MTTATELLRRALKDLEEGLRPIRKVELIDEIRAFLAAEPEAEPYAWAWDEIMSDGLEPVADMDKPVDNEHRTNIRPLYLHPPRPEPEAEPVAWMRTTPNGDQIVAFHKTDGFEPLYTRPSPSRKPMTEEEIEALDICVYAIPWVKKGIRFAEKHHGIGGGYGDHK